MLSPNLKSALKQSPVLGTKEKYPLLKDRARTKMMSVQTTASICTLRNKAAVKVIAQSQMIGNNLKGD